MPLAFCKLRPLLEKEFKVADVLLVSHSTTAGKNSEQSSEPRLRAHSVFLPDTRATPKKN